jgi:hypothetical protein
MPDYDPNRTTVVTSSGGNGGLYFIVGMLVVAVLAGAYVLMGTPGLHSQIANAPSGGGSQKIDVTVQQPATPAPATPTPAPAAPARPERR